MAEIRCCAEKQSRLQPGFCYGGMIPSDRLRILENGSVLIVFHMQLLHESTREGFTCCAEGYSAYCTVSSRQCRETLTSVSIPCSGRSNRVCLSNAESTGQTPSPLPRRNGSRPLPPVGLAEERVFLAARGLSNRKAPVVLSLFISLRISLRRSWGIGSRCSTMSIQKRAFKKVR